MSKAGIATILLLLAFLTSAVYVATHLADDIDTNILSLLPGDSHDQTLSDAIERANDEASNRVVFAIEGGIAADRRKAARGLLSDLVASGEFQNSADDGKVLWQWLFANRTQMLCPDDRVRLAKGEGGAIAREAMVQWYAPMGSGGAALLKTDPLLLTNRLLACLTPSGIRMMPNPDAEIISGVITAPVYRLDVQDKIDSVIRKWKDDPSTLGLKLERAGAIFHAAYGAAHARKEMSIIGGISTLAVLLFYWTMFRSFRAPVIAMGMVAFSLTTGLAATLFLFGSIHIIALVFGAALIGMVVDYTTYYLVTGLAEPELDYRARRARIVKPLTLGMLTSVGAFVALLFFPVSAFRQIALLGSVGLATAWAATLLLTPRVEGHAMKIGPGASWTRNVIGRFLGNRPDRRLAVGVLLVAIAVLVLGMWRGHTLDDVKKFQAPSRELVAEEAQIRSLTGFSPSAAFFLVRGDTRESATIHEEQLLTALRERDEAGAVLWAASRFDPSRTQRAADAVLIRDGLVKPHLREVLSTLGSKETNVYEGVSANSGEQASPAFIRDFRGRTGGQFWSIVPVNRALVNIPAFSFVQFVEPARQYSELFGTYRRLASYGLVLAVILTGLMLVAVYRRLSALGIVLPTVFGLLLTPAITSLLGLPFTFFSAMGLFLVAGAGVDYAIFQWENPGSAGSWTRVGIVLAAAMTCISVGMLGLSSVLPVKSFGLSVAIGVFLTLMLSPFVSMQSKSPASESEQ